MGKRGDLIGRKTFHGKQSFRAAGPPYDITANVWSRVCSQLDQMRMSIGKLLIVRSRVFPTLRLRIPIMNTHKVFITLKVRAPKQLTELPQKWLTEEFLLTLESLVRREMVGESLCLQGRLSRSVAQGRKSGV